MFYLFIHLLIGVLGGLHLKEFWKMWDGLVMIVGILNCIYCVLESDCCSLINIMLDFYY